MNKKTNWTGTIRTWCGLFVTGGLMAFAAHGERGYSRCGGVNSVPAMREHGGNMFKAAVRTANAALRQK